MRTKTRNLPQRWSTRITCGGKIVSFARSANGRSSYIAFFPAHGFAKDKHSMAVTKKRETNRLVRSGLMVRHTIRFWLAWVAPSSSCLGPGVGCHCRVSDQRH
jgi:hypothetical protein